MNRFAYLAVVGVLALATNVTGGERSGQIQFIESTVMDGFSIGITDEYGTTNFAADSRICFTVFTVSNSVPVAFPTEPKHAFQVTLHDSEGKGVRKGKRGTGAGTSFLSVDAKSLKHIKTQRLFAERKMEQFALFPIFRPSELFQIDRTGEYTLKVRFQIFVPRLGDSQSTNQTPRLLRFPAQELRINYDVQQ